MEVNRVHRPGCLGDFHQVPAAWAPGKGLFSEPPAVL